MIYMVQIFFYNIYTHHFLETIYKYIISYKQYIFLRNFLNDVYGSIFLKYINTSFLTDTTKICNS